MANVIFRLRKNGLDKNKQPKTEPVAIQVYYYHEGVEVELSTGLSVLPHQFVGSRVTDHPLKKKYNEQLSELETSLYKVHVENRNKSKLEHEAIVRELIKGEAPQKKSAVEWIASFIKESKNKPSTIQVYKSSLLHLQNFAENNKLVLSWESFDLDLYDQFTTYLYSIGQSDNTVGKVIKTIKTFISEAFERDLHTNINFKKKGFKVIQTETDEVYLPESEIVSIHNLSVEDAQLRKAKELFVFCCYTGLRFGDLSRLNPNMVSVGIDGHLYLRILTQKTSEPVVIPIKDIALQIWNAWAGCPPRPKSNPEFNEQVKKLAELAGLVQPSPKRKTVKGVVTTEWVPKWKMVKAHTCRRSYATNQYLAEYPTKSIMAVTGHKTEKAFMKYIKVTKEEHAAILAKSKNVAQPVMKIAN